MLRMHVILVALRMESVGRNTVPSIALTATNIRSLSAWRAWVEIIVVAGGASWESVALRMESVGRNSHRFVAKHHIVCRSPHGERG